VLGHPAADKDDEQSLTAAVKQLLHHAWMATESKAEAQQ
jgi:hypothetical protein